ncbi:MAG: LuxR C-terminal-related transcriptional regulator [Actinomycetota bacterium]
MDPGSNHQDLLAEGTDALRRGAWPEARSAFERATAASATPAALEGLGTAAWWENDAEMVLDARERAYRGYREAGDDAGAARVATSLALDHVAFRGEPAVANGWLQRARRLLDGRDPAPEHAFLALTGGALAVILRSDSATARRLAQEALEIGRTLGITDVEMLALALEGLALVSEGIVEDGMRRLDEATVAATGGEMEDPLAIAFTCCYMMMACERVRDFDRAGQWCLRIEEYCRRTGLQLLLSFCRSHYAAVLTCQGRWSEAEEEVVPTIADMRRYHPGIAADGLTRLGDLRRRQGRLDEAEEIFAAVEFHPRGLLGLAAVALERAKHPEAGERAERYLRRVPAENRTERAAGLEILVRARAELGDRDGAETAATEIRSLADDVGTPLLHAAADAAEAAVLAAGGRHDPARELLEDAADRYREAGAPFEEMRTRIDLARSLAALQRVEEASAEARAALEVARGLGAELDAERAEALLAEMSGRDEGHGPLTAREIEVLRLVAEGLSNREIAERLVISDHTVRRHLQNIFSKVGASTRAAATAYAFQHDLI